MQPKKTEPKTDLRKTHKQKKHQNLHSWALLAVLAKLARSATQPSYRQANIIHFSEWIQR